MEMKLSIEEIQLRAKDVWDCNEWFLENFNDEMDLERWLMCGVPDCGNFDDALFIAQDEWNYNWVVEFISEMEIKFGKKSPMTLRKEKVNKTALMVWNMHHWLMGNCEDEDDLKLWFEKGIPQDGDFEDALEIANDPERYNWYCDLMTKHVLDSVMGGR